MHRIISTFVLFAFAGALFAESPFVGTWKLNTAKTRYTSGEAPKDVTLVIEEQGDNLQVTATGIAGNGSPILVKYTVPAKGGDGQIQQGPYDAVHSKFVSENVRQNTYDKNGKEVSIRRTVVSENGKTLRSTVKGVDAMGKPVAGTDVYDKQ